MSVKILVDVCLPLSWMSEFSNAGITAVSWTSVGLSNADDSEIMLWARENDFLVFTNDLDFGILLALTRDAGPSVIQLRTLRLRPIDVGSLVLDVIKQYELDLVQGALITIDQNKTRIRLLPIKR